MLNRAPDATELANGVSGVTANQQGFALGILKSTEFRTGLFTGYYSSLLHRSVAASDQPFLNNLINSTLDVHAARILIESSGEFYTSG